MWLGICLYGVDALLWTACALAYGVRSWPKWRRTWMGRSLLGSWTSFGAVLILAVLLPLVPMPHPVAVGLSIGVLVAVGLAGLVQLVTVLHIQRLDRREAAPPSQGDTAVTETPTVVED